MLTYLFLVLIIAVERTHEPIIVEESAAVPILVNLSKEQFALNDNHPLIDDFFPVNSIPILFVNELVDIPAFPALQQILMHFVFIRYPIALRDGFYQQLTVT